MMMTFWKRRKGSAVRQGSLIAKNNVQSSLPDEILKQYALRYDGKLLLQEEYFLSSSMFQTLINEQILSPVTPIKRTISSIKCERCHNTKKHLFATIPCVRCQK